MQALTCVFHRQQVSKERGRLVVIVVLGLGVVLKVDISGAGGEDSLESGLGLDEGLDEVSEGEDEGKVSDESSGSTTPDEVGGNAEVVVVRPVALAEPSTARGGAVEGTEGNSVVEEGDAVSGVRAACSEGVEELRDEGDVLVMDDDDEGPCEENSRGGETNKGEGVSRLAEVSSEAEDGEDDGAKGKGKKAKGKGKAKAKAKAKAKGKGKASGEGGTKRKRKATLTGRKKAKKAEGSDASDGEAGSGDE